MCLRWNRCLRHEPREACASCLLHIVSTLFPSWLILRVWLPTPFPRNLRSLTYPHSCAGVAVYVYCVVTHSFNSPVGNSDMSFFIDGNLVGNFVQPPTGDTTYQYNVPVYVNESLPSGPHTIAIVNGHPDGNQSLTLLDSIVYTYVFPALSPVYVPTDPACADKILLPRRTQLHLSRPPLLPPPPALHRPQLPMPWPIPRHPAPPTRALS